MDVEMALRAVAELYSGTTMVTILPEGNGSSGGMKVAITTSWTVLPGSLLPDTVVTARLSKAYDGVSLPAFVLGGIYEHENAVERVLSLPRDGA